MNPIAITLLLLIASPFMIFAVHVILSRINPKLSPQIVALMAMVTTYLPLGFLLWIFVFCHIPLNSSAFICAVIYALMVYSCIAYSYFHVFNMSETARRIRIFYEIYKAGALPADRIISMYSSAEIVEIRLQRLLATGQLALQNGSYVMKGSFLYYVAVVVFAFRSLLGFESKKQKV